MLKEVKFKGDSYKLIFTHHALERMNEREITRTTVEDIIQSGTAIKKKKSGKWWVFKRVKGRVDNDVCISLSIEKPNLIVITTLINWRPRP